MSLNTLWNAKDLQFLLSPNDLQMGQMRLILSWGNDPDTAPEDLDLHLKFKVSDGSGADATNPESKEDANAQADRERQNKNQKPKRQLESVAPSASSSVSNETERECEVWEFNRECGSAKFETSASSRNAGGESILIYDVKKTVYTAFIRNYKQDFNRVLWGANSGLR